MRREKNHSGAIDAVHVTQLVLISDPPRRRDHHSAFVRRTILLAFRGTYEDDETTTMSECLKLYNVMMDS
jgi:phage/plasmid-associated DNA primase